MKLERFNESGQLAILEDADGNFFYYYPFAESQVVRVNNNGKECDCNAFWDMDILTENIGDEEYSIYYLSEECCYYYLNESNLYDWIGEDGYNKVLEYWQNKA